MGRSAARALLLTWVLTVPGCGPPKPPPPKVIGEAYVVPETLTLRKEIAAASGSAGALKRGDKVEILARRRRMVQARSGAVTGWIEENQLLSMEVHRRIEAASRQSTGRPSLGVYRARDVLNIHIDPQRASPSFYRLKEEEKVELLGRQVVERSAGAFDEWSLVRTAEGRAGWVLARMIDADIPDEVAQYAEGRRITSYFALSEVIDGDQVKKVWLWTTVERSLEPFDFDSFRVFNWGRRRHRYETAKIERGLKGYFPVTADGNVKTRHGLGPGFSFVVEKKDGKRYRRRYVMVGHVVYLWTEEAAPLPAPAKVEAPPPEPPPPEPRWLTRLWQRIRGR